MRAAFGVVFVASLACVACDGGDCSCEITGVIVSSSTNDLIGVSGCGHSQTCSPQQPCNTMIISPPADGGTCAVTISFVDGGTKEVTADFGTMHPSSNCCGNFYDNETVTFDVQ